MLGLVFGPLGGLLLFANSQVGRSIASGLNDLLIREPKVQELSIDYSNCVRDAPRTTDPLSPIDGDEMPASNYALNFKTSTRGGSYPQWRTYTRNVTYNRGIPTDDPDAPGGVTIPGNYCQIQFDVPNDIGPPVFLYYRLTSFYQNHRRYVKSLDTNQLLGVSVSNTTIDGGTCDPLRLNGSRPYYPCGLIANSLFNDSFQSPQGITINSNYSMTDKGIAWESDRSLYGKTAYAPKDIAVPPNWQLRWGANGYTEQNPPPDLSTYEAFQVWMRTAGLPTFSKLALRNDTSTMSTGVYQVHVLSSG